MKDRLLTSVHVASTDDLPPGWQPGPRAGYTATIPPFVITLAGGEAACRAAFRAAVEAVASNRPALSDFPHVCEEGPSLQLKATFHDVLRVAEELSRAQPPGPAIAKTILDAVPPSPPPPSIITSRGVLRFDGPPLLMGVVNITPDSFSDGGLYIEPEAACERAWQLIDEGAAIIDLGAESTRPGAEPVPAEEELRRLLPVLARLAPALPVPISVDTYKAEVAEAALSEGADIINDISGLTFDSSLAPVVARNDTTIILVHTLGWPKTMQQDPQYRWLVADVVESLAASIKKACEAGVKVEKCLIDPGLGFGKTFAHNEQLVEALGTFQQLGRPVVVGPSRKAFIRAAWGSSPEALAEGTAVVCRRAAELGASVLRVHDVAVVRRALTEEAWKVHQRGKG